MSIVEDLIHEFSGVTSNKDKNREKGRVESPSTDTVKETDKLFKKLWTEVLDEIGDLIERDPLKGHLLENIFGNRLFMQRSDFLEEKINKEWLKPEPDIGTFKRLIREWRKLYLSKIPEIKKEAEQMPDIPEWPGE